MSWYAVRAGNRKGLGAYLVVPAELRRHDRQGAPTGVLGEEERDEVSQYRVVYRSFEYDAIRHDGHCDAELPCLDCRNTEDRLRELFGPGHTPSPSGGEKGTSEE